MAIALAGVLAGLWLSSGNSPDDVAAPTSLRDAGDDAVALSDSPESEGTVLSGGAVAAVESEPRESTNVNGRLAIERLAAGAYTWSVGGSSGQAVVRSGAPETVGTIVEL